MKDALCRYIESELLPANHATAVAAEDDLLGIGMLDSLKLMRLVKHIEETHGFSVPPEDLLIDHFQSVSLIAAYIERRQSA